jgi:hypothetical protein
MSDASRKLEPWDLPLEYQLFGLKDDSLKEVIIQYITKTLNVPNIPKEKSFVIQLLNGQYWAIVSTDKKLKKLLKSGNFTGYDNRKTQLLSDAEKSLKELLNIHFPVHRDDGAIDEAFRRHCGIETHMDKLIFCVNNLCRGLHDKTIQSDAVMSSLNSTLHEVAFHFEKEIVEHHPELRKNFAVTVADAEVS